MIPEPFARTILQTAINEGKAAALLECLFAGGTVTIDPDTRKLVLIRLHTSAVTPPKPLADA